MITLATSGADVIPPSSTFVDIIVMSMSGVSPGVTELCIDEVDILGVNGLILPPTVTEDCAVIGVLPSPSPPPPSPPPPSPPPVVGPPVRVRLAPGTEPESFILEFRSSLAIADLELLYTLSNGATIASADMILGGVNFMFSVTGSISEVETSGVLITIDESINERLRERRRIHLRNGCWRLQHPSIQHVYSSHFGRDGPQWRSVC